MKIHGTAQGGALSKKDFGVAFGGVGNGGCSNFEDSLGTDANGTNSGSTINTSGQKLGDGCVSFDGSNDFINLNGISGTEAFSTNVGSITMWINSGDDTQEAPPFAFADTDAQTFLLIRVDSEMLISQLKVGNVFKWNVKQTSVMTEGQWVWVAIVQDGTAVKYFVNNVEITSFDNDDDKTAWVTSAMDNCRAGCINKNSAGNSQFFDGLVDDIGIFDTAIDSTTRDFLYNSGTGRKISQLESCDNVKAYYNCDEFDNSTLTNNAVPIE